MPICTTFRVNGASLVCTQFIETGFYRGATSVCAHYAGFKRVASVELDADLYARGLKLPLVADGKILLYHGHSPEVLPQMIDPSLRTLIYLDAHHCGSGDVRVNPECPVLDELGAVFDLPWDEYPTVVIDDANMFQRPWNDDLNRRFDPDQWPSTREVKDSFPAGYRFVDDYCVLYALPER